jgi:uncharacterized protein (DUF2062 family)
MLQKKNKILSILKKTYERFLKIRGHPREIGLGFAMGIFVGMTPSLGFQTAIVIFFAALLKWNKVSAIMGVWITNPLTAPFVYGVNYVVGAKLLGIKKAYVFTEALSLGTISKMLQKAPEILWALILGGVILGLPLAVAGYFFAYSVVQRYQEGIKIKLARQKEKLAARRKRRRGKAMKKIKNKKWPYPPGKPVTTENQTNALKDREKKATPPHHEP